MEGLIDQNLSFHPPAPGGTRMGICTEGYKHIDTGSNRKKLLSELQILKLKYESTGDSAVLDEFDSKLGELEELFIVG